MGIAWGTNFEMLREPPLTSATELPQWFGDIADNVQELVVAFADHTEFMRSAGVDPSICEALTGVVDAADQMMRRLHEAKGKANELYSNLPVFRKAS